MTSTGVIVARGNRPLWSPDRTKLLFTTYNSSLQKVTIYTIDSGYTYGNTNRPGETPIIEYVAFGDPKWSPDSRKISFFKNLDNGKTLMTANADGSEMKQLGVTQISDVYWSPDSSKVVYAKLERAGGETGPLYIVNADGTGNKLIANSSYVGWYADWHPTGSKLVYNKMIGALGYIAVINLDGSGEVTFGRGRYPVWSSDGTKIAFDRLNNTDNKMYIYEMNADGTGETLLTRGERPVYQPGQRI